GGEGVPASDRAGVRAPRAAAARGTRCGAEPHLKMPRKTSFYYSFLVLPAEQRRAIVAVWDFCRAVDDAVDEAPDGMGSLPSGRDAVSVWRAELARSYNGRMPQTAQGLRLQ